jgi:NTE family protein
VAVSISGLGAATAALLALSAHQALAQEPPPKRPVIGVAFGGGSALGLAHVGVIRWLEEHRVPIDVVAGTSMGGLIGGAFAAGMSSADLKRLLAVTDWAELFGTSPYRYRSIARKEDVRAYPSRIELELRRRVDLPSALNNGQQVDLFLARLVAPYVGLRSFDVMPTPFRCVAVDVRTAERVVLDSGSLTRALRATMSLPGIFPPVEIGDRLLVDGGVLDNVPADVVREMGADVVIAVNVGRPPDRREVKTSLFALVNSTVDAMMRASTRRGLAAADIVINPTLERFDRFDWELAETMADEGYAATEAVGESLLPYALSDDAWRQYLAQRAAKRKSAMPRIGAVEVVGAVRGDERLIRRRLASFVNRPLDTERLKAELLRLSALDRYQSVSWDLRQDAGVVTLVVHARRRDNAPPIAMFGTNIQNLTSDDFTFQLAARYLGFDAFIPGGELRLDVAVGSNPHLGAEWRRPIGQSGLFVAFTGAVARLRRSFSVDNAIIAQYDQEEMAVQGELGYTAGTTSELRGGVRVGHTDLDVRVGNPGLPSMSGAETQLRLRWTYDSQTHYLAPSSGLRLIARSRYVIAAADPPPLAAIRMTNDGLVQAELHGSLFWSARDKRDRVFVTGAGGTSFDGRPLPTDQFPLGLPMRLDGFGFGERRGDHFGVLTVGYLHAIHHLPEFFGGSVFLGGWLENGSAFDTLDEATLETQVGAGLLVETLIGPALVGATAGVHGERRLFVGFGRIFP